MPSPLHVALSFPGMGNHRRKKVVCVCVCVCIKLNAFTPPPFTITWVPDYFTSYLFKFLPYMWNKKTEWYSVSQLLLNIIGHLLIDPISGFV